MKPKQPFVASPFHLPYNPKLTERAKMLRQNMTPAEKKLWQGCLRRFPHRVLKQRPIDNFIVDFYCAELKLVIEVDGERHNADEARVYDEERTQKPEGYGLRVLRFTNDEVLHQLARVCEEIGRAAREDPPCPPYKGGL